MPYLSVKPQTPSPPAFRVKAEYSVKELADAARLSPDAMRRRLRGLGFPAPGRRRPERILYSDLRSLAPAFLDSLTRAALSDAEARAVRRRLAHGGA